MSTAHCFPWPNNEGQSINIDYVIQYPATGELVMFPVNFPDDPSFVVNPADLSVYSLDRLIAGVTTLADYARNTADRLDETAQRLTLMRPAVRAPF